MTKPSAEDRERLIRELLARRGVISGRRTAPAIGRRAPGVRIPLSPLQEGMWFLDQLAPGNPAYVLSVSVRLTGPLDTVALQEAVDEVVRRHEALRTAIVLRNGRTEQVVRDADDCRVTIRIEDLSALPTERREEQARALSRNEIETGFDLNQAPIMRVLLVRIDQDDHLLTICLHHILSDERSLTIVLTEVLDGYHRLRSGGGAVPEPPLQYPDYVVWRAGTLDDAAIERQRRFWSEQLAGVPGILALPTDRPRPRTQTFPGATYRFPLSADLTAAVDDLTSRTGCTRFVIVMTALQVLLSRWSGQTDICVGTPVSTRSRPELQSVVGLMVNSLPVRVDLSGDPTLEEALQRVRRACAGSLDHTDLPLSELVELAGLPRDLGHNPLFQTMCVLNPVVPAREWDELSVQPVGFGRETSRLDLTLMVYESRPALTGVIDYNTDLFDRSTIERFAERYQLVLRALTAEPERRLSQLDLRTADEPRELAEWNSTDRDYPPVTGLHELIRAQAETAPDAAAVVDGDTVLSYGELIRRADLLALRLRAAGAGPDVPVGLALPAGIPALVGLVGVLQAGGAYLPLDPTHPPARVLSLLDDAAAPLLITDAAHAERFTDYSGTLLLVDDAGLATSPGPEAPGNAPPCHPDQLAYVIYTSGSTGAPKGVMVSHRSAVNLARAFVDLHDIGPSDRLLMLPPLSFDASVGDIFPALIAGATLVVHRRPAELTGPDLLRFCAKHDITLVDTAAALWVRWTADLAGTGSVPDTPLRAMMIGGEAAPISAVRDWARTTGGRVALYNHYGPTEGTVCATTYRTLDGTELPGLTHLPIGRPLPNVRVHLLDAALRPVPIGMIGEVYIGGAAPARGYLGAPGMTAERFVPDPYGEPGARLYRTGDLARHRPDGTLEFLGRTDRQVKIRGHRIDVGEVEAACRALPGVTRVAVVARDDGRGKRLVAYLVAADEPVPTPAEIRTALRQRLPDYLVPSAFVFLPELPLTRHGKLDEAALPAPTDQATGAERVPPRTPTERRLAGIWADLLGGGEIGIGDNFFDLGGHSLLAGPLAARVATEFGVDLPLRAVFETADLASLAALIDQTVHAGGDRPAPRRAPQPEVIRADAELPDEICANLPDQPPAADPEAVLVTGATGFLGAHLVADWLDASNARLHCLVRATSPEAALARVRDNLARYGLWHDRYADRLVGVPGDLGEPGLGLSRYDFDALADGVDAVVHNGGVVNFLKPYELLRPANVDGTREVIRLAATGRPTALHMVSTLGVFLTPARRGALVSEHDVPDDCAGLAGYNASKWAADALARAARERGLTVSIYRPARITGQSVTGVGNTDDYFSRLLKTFIQLGAVPEILDDEADLMPVDHVAAGIGYLSRHPDRWGQDFHFYNNRTISFPDLAKALSSFGYPVGLAPYPQWRSALLARPDAALAPFTPLFGPALPRRTQPDFDCTATETALAVGGLACPPADAALIHTYLSWFVQTGFLDAPTLGRTGD